MTRKLNHRRYRPYRHRKRRYWSARRLRNIALFGTIGFLAVVSAFSWLRQGTPMGEKLGLTTDTAQYTYYARCADARRAGAAPIYRGQPGYRPALDADNDGVACEPYFGR